MNGETTLAGDITVTVCLAALTAASFYLGWQVFLAVREAVLS
jgi:hypothetical protein